MQSIEYKKSSQNLGGFMLKMRFLLLITSIFYSISAYSQFYDGNTQTLTPIESLLRRVQPGTVLVVGEQHAQAAHRDQHMEILQGLRALGLKVSVGMEFVNYTDQNALNNYRSGQLPEADFLRAINWGGFSYDFYRQQILFPHVGSGEHTVGLNIPRQITSKISRQGLEGLTDEEQALLPPNFQQGRDSYFNRFMLVAGAHCKSPKNCFLAQSAWDDTMAWQAGEFVRSHPDHVLVIIVGEFHVQYGGGLPDRLRARYPGLKIMTVSQIWAEGMLDEEVLEQMEPSLIEGARADFIWFSGR